MNAKIFSFTTALVAATLFTAASAQAEGSAESFIGDAMKGNLGEVNIGKLAQQNSQNAKVQAYGTLLRNDHSKAYYAAARVAEGMGQPVATEPMEEQQEVYHKLEKLKGVEFDRAFIEGMIDDHKNDIATYEKEARRDDGAAAAYARSSLPTLRKHLKVAQQLAGGR